MRYAIKLRSKGQADAAYMDQRILGLVTFRDVEEDSKKDYFRAISKKDSIGNIENFAGYLGILVETDELRDSLRESALVLQYPSLDFIKDDYVVAIETKTGMTIVLYRPESRNNSIFATGRCNSNCIMCSQPPTTSDGNSIVNEHLRLIKLIKEAPEVIGITGGEPTLLKQGLVDVIKSIRDRFPDTYIHMLTNGRLLAYEDLARDLAQASPDRQLLAIPLYSDVPTIHDYIVQDRGAFDQTINGLLNCARYGIDIEIRVVLHKQTVSRLVKLMEYIYRNLPFVSRIALMGLENMGYVKKNWDILWEDPVDYLEELKEAVKYARYRGMNVSVYNLPLCVLPPSIWSYARQSISDYKNIYLDLCDECDVKSSCAGLFSSAEERHSRDIHPIHMDTGIAEFYLYGGEEQIESCELQ